jgi:hypothetical protein
MEYTVRSRRLSRWYSSAARVAALFGDCNWGFECRVADSAERFMKLTGGDADEIVMHSAL